MTCPHCHHQNIAIHDRRTNRLRCRNCGKTWVAHRQAFHYGLRTSEIQVRRALQLLKAGFSIRRAAQLVKVSPGTVLRWKKKSLNF